MIEIQADMWTIIPEVPEHAPDAVCVTTCQVTDSRGDLIMGAGIAKQAKARHKELPRLWGQSIQEGKEGLIITTNIAPYALVAFPTKRDWRYPSSPDLIRESAMSLLEATNERGWKSVFLPRPGCSNGRLVWENVKPILEDVGLDNRFLIFSL